MGSEENSTSYLTGNLIGENTILSDGGNSQWPRWPQTPRRALTPTRPLTPMRNAQDQEVFDLSGSNIRNSTHTRRTIDIPNIEEAYNQFISSRDDNLYISPDEGGLTEDDVLCNTNLRTAGLFKGYNEELKKIQGEYQVLASDEDIFVKSLQDQKKALSEIYNKVQVYHVQSIDTMNSNHLILSRSMSSVEVAVLNEIQTKKSNLDAKIDKIIKKLNTLRPLIQAGIDGLIDKDSANSKKMCAICFDREVDTVMVPCGHTSCTGCSNYNSSSKCMHCRTHIQKRVKIYFSI